MYMGFVNSSRTMGAQERSGWLTEYIQLEEALDNACSAAMYVIREEQSMARNWAICRMIHLNGIDKQLFCNSVFIDAYTGTPWSDFDAFQSFMIHRRRENLRSLANRHIPGIIET